MTIPLLLSIGSLASLAFAAGYLSAWKRTT